MKTSISLRPTPPELHVIKEALRLYDYILQWQLNCPETKPPDFTFNFGILTDTMTVIAVNELIVEMGGTAPLPKEQPKQIEQPTTRQQIPAQTPRTKQGGGLWREVKSAYRQGYMAHRVTKRLFKI